MKKTILVMALICACSATFISCDKDGNSPSHPITCTPSVIEDSGKGGDYQVILQSKASWSVTVDKKWVSVSPTSGEGDAFVTITIALGSADSAHVMFSNSSSSAIVTIYRAITKPGGGGSGTHNNHAYIDLGLTVKWATMNVGATKVEEYGNYFAWGETTPKTDYSWSTYKYCKGDYNNMTKYCVSSSYGTVDNKTTLEKSDDAASVNWGGNWRMPTHAEQEELKNNCTITWTDNYQGTGVAGCILTSKKTGYTDKSIFLPAAGYRDDTNLYNAGSYGYYWSSSLYEDYSGSAWGLSFNSDYVYTNNYGDRYYGRSVRAVCP